MSIAIIKYNAGNIQSVLYALQRLGAEAMVTDDHDLIRGASRVIFPGVGNAAAAMASLKEGKLDKLIKTLTQPVLGICVGLQLLCNHSEENDTRGLGIFDLSVKKFISQNNDKVPQVGWNTIENYSSPILKDVIPGAYVYYVHSYYAELGKETAATTHYMFPYTAVAQKNNFYGVQFHAEKSAAVGEKILFNFLNID
ncbi:MAG: imidazole glycerol phosphate synthase subunit HisH [Ginsengibacter sp.]